MSRRTVLVVVLALGAAAAGLAFWFRPAPVTPVAVLEPSQVADHHPFFPFETSSQELSRLLNQAYRRSGDGAGGSDPRRVCVVVVGGPGVMDSETSRPMLELSDGQRLAPAGKSMRVDYVPDQTTADRFMAAFTFRLPAGATPTRFRAGDIDLRCKPVTNEEFVRHCEKLRGQPVRSPPEAQASESGSSPK